MHTSSIDVLILAIQISRVSDVIDLEFRKRFVFRDAFSLHGADTSQVPLSARSNLAPQTHSTNHAHFSAVFKLFTDGKGTGSPNFVLQTNCKHRRKQELSKHLNS